MGLREWVTAWICSTRLAALASHIMGERGNHLIALGIVRLGLVELGLQSFLQEGADGRSVACLATCSGLQTWEYLSKRVGS